MLYGAVSDRIHFQPFRASALIGILAIVKVCIIRTTVFPLCCTRPTALAVRPKTADAARSGTDDSSCNRTKDHHRRCKLFWSVVLEHIIDFTARRIVPSSLLFIVPSFLDEGNAGQLLFEVMKRRRSAYRRAGFQRNVIGKSEERREASLT